MPSAADDTDGDVVVDFVPDSGVGNPIVYATYDGGAGAGAGATDARYAGYEPPGVALPPPATGAVYVGGSAAPPAHGGAAAPEIVYATPFEDDRLVVPRVPNPLHQSADGPPNDGGSLVQVPNVMYEPAANNTHAAGVNSNANRTAITATAGNGGSGGYYDADLVPSDESADYATVAELQPESNNNSSV